MSDCLKAFWSFVYTVTDLWMEAGRRERHVTLAPAMEANALFTLPCQSATLDNFAIHYPIFNHQRTAKSKAYTANPDYDITRLICSHILTLNWACTHWGGQTSLKEASKTYSHSQRQVKINVTKNKVWATEQKHKERGRVQKVSNQLMLVGGSLQIRVSNILHLWRQRRWKNAALKCRSAVWNGQFCTTKLKRTNLHDLNLIFWHLFFH